MIIDLGETWSSPIYRVTDTLDALGDAGTVVYTIRLAGATVATGNATRISLGQYTVDYLTAAEGRHEVEVVATGGVLGTLTREWSDAFNVDAYTAFISVDDALDHMRAQATITTPADREQVRDLCQRACSAIEDDLGRTIARRTRVEEHDACRPVLTLRQGPALSLTSIMVDGTTAAADTYRLDASAGLVYSRYGWRGSGWPSVATVTYVAGMAAVPKAIRTVALHLVTRMWQVTQQMPHPNLDDSGGAGGDFAALAELAAAGRVDPITYRAYESYRIQGFA